jgi:hypothetical protein
LLESLEMEVKRNPETCRFGDDPAPFKTYRRILPERPTRCSPCHEPKTRRKQIPKSHTFLWSIALTTDSSFAPNSASEAETIQSTQRLPALSPGQELSVVHSAARRDHPPAKVYKSLWCSSTSSQSQKKLSQPSRAPRPRNSPLHPTFHLGATYFFTSWPAHPSPRSRPGHYSNDSSGRCKGKRTYQVSRAGSSTTTIFLSGR